MGAAVQAKIQWQRLVASTLALAILGVLVTIALIGDGAIGVLVLVIPVVPVLPLGVSYLVHRPEGTNPNVNLAVMLVCAAAAAATTYYFVPQLQPLMKLAF